MQHEDLIEDVENQERPTLDHCGVAFEPARVKFHESKRSLRMPIWEQMRQPIFQDGWIDSEIQLLARPSERHAGRQSLSRLRGELLKRKTKIGAILRHLALFIYDFGRSSEPKKRLQLTIVPVHSGTRHGIDEWVNA